MSNFVALFCFGLNLIKSLQISNQDLSGDNIVCNFNDDCIVTCNSNQGYYCDGLTLTCQNHIGLCRLTCIGNDACNGVQLIANHVKSIELLCSDNACNDMVSQISLLNFVSIAHIQCNGIKSCYNATFIVDTPSSNSNTANYITDGNDPRVYIGCDGIESCQRSTITVIGIDNFGLDCDDTRSCSNIALTMTSLDPKDSGYLDVNCNGYESCYNGVINGISSNIVDINCADVTGSCEGIQVYCPLYPFGIITTNTNDNAYFTYDNIDADTCKINFNYQEQSVNIYSPYGSIATNTTNIQTNTSIPVFCEFDWFKNSSCSHINESTDITSVNSDFISLCDPHGNYVECNGNNDCTIFVSQQLNTYESNIMNIMCANKHYTCTVVCMTSYACKDAVINGTQAKILRIKTNEFGSYHSQGMIIHAPNGEESELNILNTLGNYGLQRAIIYANNTDSVFLNGFGDNIFQDLTIYAYNTSSLNIDCTNGNNQCNNMEVTLYHHGFDISQPMIPTNRMNINCNDTNQCNDLEINIYYYQCNQPWQCIYQYNTSCNAWKCIPPSITPTPSTTKNNKILSNYININGFIIPFSLLIWIGVAIFGCCMMCLFSVIIYCWCHHRKLKKAIKHMNESNITDITNTTLHSDNTIDPTATVVNLPHPQIKQIYSNSVHSATNEPYNTGDLSTTNQLPTTVPKIIEGYSFNTNLEIPVNPVYRPKLANNNSNISQFSNLPIRPQLMDENSNISVISALSTIPNNPQLYNQNSNISMAAMNNIQNQNSNISIQNQMNIPVQNQMNIPVQKQMSNIPNNSNNMQIQISQPPSSPKQFRHRKPIKVDKPLEPLDDYDSKQNVLPKPFDDEIPRSSVTSLNPESYNDRSHIRSMDSNATELMYVKHRVSTKKGPGF